MTLIKIFLSLILIITLSLFLFGILSYEGNKIYYSAFTLVSIFQFFIVLDITQFLLKVFWLYYYGWDFFWFKFTVQISF